MSIADKIESKLDELENMMYFQVHLTDPTKVSDLLDSLSMYWEHIGDDDKDFIECASDVLKNKREWIV